MTETEQTENNSTETVVSIRIKNERLAIFDSKIGNQSRAKVIRDLIDKFCETTLTVLVDYNALRNECLKARKMELSLSKILQNEYCGRVSAYEFMIDFAASLGTDLYLEKAIDKVLEKLITYKLQPEDQFNQTILNCFIEFVEAVLDRRRLEKEISSYRKAKLGKNGNLGN